MRPGNKDRKESKEGAAARGLGPTGQAGDSGLSGQEIRDEDVTDRRGTSLGRADISLTRNVCSNMASSVGSAFLPSP